MPENVFLICHQCHMEQQEDLGTSDLGNIPDRAIAGEPIHDGSLHDWVASHHKKFAGEHNRFTVCNADGEIIGEAGFGGMVGYVYWQRGAGFRQPSI